MNLQFIVFILFKLYNKSMAPYTELSRLCEKVCTHDSDQKVSRQPEEPRY